MKKRPAMTTLHRLVFCGEVEGGYVVRQGKSGLYEFPYKECEPRAGGVVHHFTRYKIYLHPQQVAGDLAEGVVKTLRELQQLPFSAGHKKILELIVAGSLW